MIIRTTAIPLAIHPYSSTSRVVHWLTRGHGKVSTLLKGALRPKSPFLGEYELFSTSELLYFAKRSQTLHTGKECALLQRRAVFRHDWRATQAASYLAALLNRTTPDEAPQPGLFEFYETQLDYASVFGRAPQFLLWMELKFCEHHGHAPNTGQCLICSTKTDLRFCASQGGTVCGSCAREKKLPTLPASADVLAMLRAWLQAEHPGAVVKTRLTGRQLTEMNAIAGTFMKYHFHMPPEFRNAALQPAI